MELRVSVGFRLRRAFLGSAPFSRVRDYQVGKKIKAYTLRTAISIDIRFAIVILHPKDKAVVLLPSN